MREIDFFLIGAQKSGTTTLYSWLRQAPQIFLPKSKENRFFADDEFYRQGVRYLEPYYRDCTDQAMLGSAYVHHMYFSHVAQRIQQYNPRARFIAVLRDPVDRAYSAYRFARYYGWEPAPTFEEALEREPQRLQGSFTERAALTYVDHGRYAQQLQRYVDLFGRERLHVVLTEELRRDADRALRETLTFLGLSPDTSAVDLARESNVAPVSRLTWLQRLITRPDSWYRRAARRVLPQRVRIAVHENLVLPLVRLNTRSFDYVPMREETRDRLRSIFREDNERLSALLGREICWK